jgi:hypothetical protein
MLSFNVEDIHKIYNKHVVKTKKYFEKFQKINKYLSEKELYDYKHIDPPRIASLLDFKEWIIKYNIHNGSSLLYSCDSDPELNYIDYKQQSYIPYPPYDLHNLNIIEKNHDLVIFNQTLEHLYNPFMCLKNLYDHTKPGGFLYTTVPIINIPHMRPIHFWGITPIGLCILMMSVGFNVLECGYWGNKQYIDYIFTNNNWPTYENICEQNGLSYNEVCQTQTWILVQK